jgi:TonB family protein
VSFSGIHRWLAGGLLAAGLGAALIFPPVAAAERKVKQKVNPSYPELAKKMAVSGSVKVQLTVAPNGSVKSWKVIGGHPLLVDAAVDAVKRWKYEPAADESVELVEFKFSPAE